MSTDFDQWAAEMEEDAEVSTVLCRCGHPEFQHSHYRQGNDCVVCGCMNYQAPIDLLAVAMWLTLLIACIGGLLGLLYMAGAL